MNDAFPPADIVAAMNDPATFGGWFRGASWGGWRVVLKAAFAMPMSNKEIEFFRAIADRDPPRERVRELWCVCGRGAGKDSVASVIVAHTAAMFNRPKPVGTLAKLASVLRGGERALCMALACDRDQAKIVLGYTKSYFNEIPSLRAMVTRETQHGFELSNRVDVAIATNSFRSVRGRSILAVVLEECSFWKDETSSTPDEEVYAAVLPGLARISGSMLIGISSPYRKSGLLYRKFKEHYGRDSSDILVIRAPSMTMNPTLDRTIVERAIAEDPAKAKAEWLAEFRDDLSGWADLALIEAAVDYGVKVRPPRDGVSYFAFCDPSGGARDSFTCAITHNEGGVAVLDCVVEIRAPFNPDSAVAEIAGVLKSYRITRVVADRYAAQWPVAAFARNGFKLAHSDRDRSEIYLDALPLFTTGRVRLIENRKLVTQFAALERRTSPIGKDRVDHGRNGADDLCNSAAGAFIAAVERTGPRVHAIGVETYGSHPTHGYRSSPIGHDGWRPNRNPLIETNDASLW